MINSGKHHLEKAPATVCGMCGKGMASETRELVGELGCHSGKKTVQGSCGQPRGRKKRFHKGWEEALWRRQVAALIPFSTQSETPGHPGSRAGGQMLRRAGGSAAGPGSLHGKT